ncbi:galectin-1-like [Pyxicephalus adspersus]
MYASQAQGAGRVVYLEAQICDGKLVVNHRFDLSGVTNKLIFSWRENNICGEEQKEDVFPLQKGSDTTNVIIQNLNIKPGQIIEVLGVIPENCNYFSINLGQNSENLLLHFQPRFNFRDTTDKIVCNSKQNNVWGEQQIEDFFPFQEGSETLIRFKIRKDEIIILLSSGSWFSFPVRFPMDVIPYLSLENLQFRKLNIE